MVLNKGEQEIVFPGVIAEGEIETYGQVTEQRV